MKSVCKYEPKKSCFAFNADKNKCNALSELVCRYEDCVFYQNKNAVNTKDIEKDIYHYGCTLKNTTTEKGVV